MNNENLKRGNPDTQFRSGREAVENGRKGGRASGISRSFRSAVKKRLKSSPELFPEIIDMLIAKTLDGDLKAFELLLELAGESPKQMEISLKKRELKLKEESMKNTAVGENELPALLSALEAEDGESE